MRAIALCLLVAVPFALAGCGGESSEKTSPPSTQASAAAPKGKPFRQVLPRSALADLPRAAAFLDPTQPAPAAAAGVPPDSCQGQWTVPSPLVFQQGYDYWITLYLKQKATRIWGMAGYKIGKKETWGNVSGAITGNRLFARVYWTFSGVSAVGVYTGDIGPWAWIFEGTTYDQLARPPVFKQFNSSKTTLFYCAPLPGYAEVTHIGVPAAEYQTVFDRFTKAGYRPVWLDGFEARGRAWFNVVFQPDNGPPWVARHNLTSAQYQADFDTLPKQGLRPLHIESYGTPEGTRYASIWVKAAGPPWLAYHDRSPSEHQAQFNKLTAEGWRPVIIAVTPAGGERRYTALYEKKDVGSFAAYQVLTPAEYQTQFDQQGAAGRKLVYLNAYNDGGARFTAIWHANAPGAYVRHAMTTEQYLGERDAQRKQGLLTRGLIGYVDGINLYYAAIWTK